MLRIRQATLADAEMLLDWRNDKISRQSSCQTKIIPLDTHLTWLREKLADPNTLIYIFETNQPVGQVRFEKKRNSAEVSIVVAPAERGHGVGKEMLEQATILVFSIWPVNKIIAKVKMKNAASLHLFNGCGFKVCKKDGSLLCLTLPNVFRMPNERRALGEIKNI
jgi:RimJ/RimL family protein N-acetyltransferase